MQKRLSVIGTGYIGLTTAVCFAKLGFEVVCIDVDKNKVDMVNSGKSPIFEEEIDEYLDYALKNGMTATTDYSKIKDTDISFICVGTPTAEDGSMDVSYIESAADSIGEAIKNKKEKHIVVIKSTVVPGTNRHVGEIIAKYTNNFSMISNPEFLQEGKSIHDFMQPDRVVIGSDDKEAVEEVAKLYESLNTKFLKTNLETSEMIKYVNNTFLATKVSFINEIANLCEKIPNVDVGDVAKGIGMDNRINPKFFNAGVGYGGSCFSKDVRALIKFAEEKDMALKIPIATEEVNKTQPLRAVELLKEEIGELQNKKIGILGIAFKPGTDDTREAPGIKVVNSLLEQGAVVSIYDPKAMGNIEKIFGEKIAYEKSAEALVMSSEAVILLTEWPEFVNIKPELFKGKVLIDGRRMFLNAKLEDVKYRTIGFG